MQISEEEALDILNKWKDESAPVFVFGENPSRWGLRHVDEGGVDWNVGLRGKISDVFLIEWVERTSTVDGKIRVERIIGKEPLGNVSAGKITSKAARVVVFEGLGGGASLLLDTCVFAYCEPCEGPPFLPMKAASCLSIFFASNELFVVYKAQMSASHLASP